MKEKELIIKVKEVFIWSYFTNSHDDIKLFKLSLNTLLLQQYTDYTFINY